MCFQIFLFFTMLIVPSENPIVLASSVPLADDARIAKTSFSVSLEFPTVSPFVCRQKDGLGLHTMERHSDEVHTCRLELGRKIIRKTPCALHDFYLSPQKSVHSLYQSNNP